MEDIRKGVCPLCGHDRVIDCKLNDGFSLPPAIVRPRTMSLDQEPRGVLHLWACRRCGFSQLFASEPDKVPIGEKHGTTLVQGTKTAGPYR